MELIKFFKNQIKSKIIPLTTFDLINIHKICSPMNKLEFTMRSDDIPRAWLNPNDQESFNYGWFTEEDFKDWMNGTGNIIKGKTPEEKKKFWDYAVFLKTYKNGWMVSHHIDDFGLLIDDTSNVTFDSRSREITKPLKITKTNKEEIIGSVFGCMVKSLTNDFIGNDGNDTFILKRFYNETWGAKLALYNLGCGYFGYSNTPKSILNLSWVPDIVVAKAYYNYLEINNVEFPDFEFVKNYRK
jgi:hypothetical protein